MQTAPLSRRARLRAAVIQLRAAVIAFFVFFNVLAALPTLGTPSAERLARPFEQAELRRWASLGAAFGLELEPERLAQIYLVLVGGLAEARERALTPISGWISFTQTSQRWSLFGTPDEFRSLLRISAHTPAGEELLYQSGHSERRWNAAVLEYRRIRAAYNPSRSGPPHTYAGLCQRLSEQIFESFPEVDRVHIALIRSRIALPGEAPDPTLEEEHVREFSRPSG
jgi:hypothetical protein